MRLVRVTEGEYAFRQDTASEFTLYQTTNPPLFETAIPIR